MVGQNLSTRDDALDHPVVTTEALRRLADFPRFGGIDFADGGNALTATTHMELPSDWVGQFDVKFIWFSGSTSTNSVVWTLRTSCIADTELLLSPTYNTEQTVVDANNAVASTRNSASITNVTPIES